MNVNVIPKNYRKFANMKGPKLMVAAFELFGTKETPGAKSNPEILRWAKICGLAKDYVNDGIAWCGLLIAYLCHLTDKDPVIAPLWALNWRWWGVEVKRGDEQYGDLYIKERRDNNGKLIGGHVGLIVGEDETHFHVLGGNQNDTICIVRISKEIKYWCRRPAYINKPKEVQKYRLSPGGLPAGRES